jgi:hypothetical protein
MTTMDSRDDIVNMIFSDGEQIIFSREASAKEGKEFAEKCYNHAMLARMDAANAYQRAFSTHFAI